MRVRLELFASIRRDARVDGLSVRGLAKRYQVGRDTVRQAWSDPVPPTRKTPARSLPRLDPFRPALNDHGSDGEVLGPGTVHRQKSPGVPAGIGADGVRRPRGNGQTSADRCQGRAVRPAGPLPRGPQDQARRSSWFHRFGPGAGVRRFHQRPRSLLGCLTPGQRRLRGNP
jgi:hypothetical protein